MRRIVPYFRLSRAIARVDDRILISGIIFAIKNRLRWRGGTRENGPQIRSIPAYPVESDGHMQQDIRKVGRSRSPTKAINDRHNASESSSYRRTPEKKDLFSAVFGVPK